MTFANRLDPDQAQQNIGPDLDPSCLTLLYSWTNVLKEKIWKKKIGEDKNRIRPVKHAKSKEHSIAQTDLG